MLHSHSFILAALRYVAVTMEMNKTAAELRDHSAAVFLFFELSNIYVQVLSGLKRLTVSPLIGKILLK